VSLRAQWTAGDLIRMGQPLLNLPPAM
jgi:hypothetical protein